MKFFKWFFRRGTKFSGCNFTHPYTRMLLAEKTAHLIKAMKEEKHEAEQ
jgi:hypothetical protein